MNFVTGTFIRLKAINEFNYGPLNGMTISVGTEMEFDGTTLKLNGQTYTSPQFNLPIRAKFVVPVDDYTSTYAPPASKVEVHSASGRGTVREAVHMGTAVEEEQVVGSVGLTNDRRANPGARQVQAAQVPGSNRREGSEPEQLSGRQLTVEEADRINSARLHAETQKPVTKGFIGGNRVDRPDDAGQGSRTAGGGKYQVHVTDGASQGVVVGVVKSGSHSAHVGVEGEAVRRPVTDMTRVDASAVERGLQPQKVVEGIRGLEAKTASVAEGIRNTGAHVYNMSEAIRENPPKPMRSSTVVTDGEDIHTVRGGTTGDVQYAMSTDSDSVADLLPGALVAGLPVRKAAPVVNKAPELTPEEEIAAILANWSTKRQWQTRVQDALNYADWPEALDAICAIESPAVVRHIKSGLAKLAAEG